MVKYNYALIRYRPSTSDTPEVAGLAIFHGNKVDVVLGERYKHISDLRRFKADAESNNGNEVGVRAKVSTAPVKPGSVEHWAHLKQSYIREVLVDDWMSEDVINKKTLVERVLGR